MSTANGVDRKRKPSEVNPGSSPASKHIKVENGAMASAGMAGNPAITRRTQLQALLSAQPNMTEDTKMKYLSGLDQLRLVVESKGAGSQEGQAAQNKYDAIVNKLKNTLRQIQQSGYQNHQPNGAVVNNGGAVAQGAVASMAGGLMNPAARQNWIVPASVPVQNAEQWRTEIQAKLTQVGQKMNHARSQIVLLQQNQQQPGITPEQHRDIQNRIAEHSQQYNHFRDIINKFGQQQKMLAEQKHQNLTMQNHQGRVGQPQGQQGQIPMQQPAHQGTVPEVHIPPQQPQQQHGGMMGAGLQANTGSNVQGNLQNHHQQQPVQPTGQIQQQQPRPPQQQPQQPQQQNPHTVANTQQRIATPIQRADSPPGPVNNPGANRATMSPAAQQPPLQQQPQQQPQQPGQPQVARPTLQAVPQATVAGRSPAATAVVAGGTPMAPPNSPASRAGSAQPARPPTTPVSQTPQQPGQPQPQQPQRMQPASSASAASPTTNTNPAQTPRDTAQGHRLPIPKNLAVAAPQPIAMPPARPTLSGGMNSSGNQIMSTPAIIKQPAFEFDEGGMGLLSKRKLEELVKQIDPEEKLDPDVEESILELVDEFIDNIATTACKMAKLRGSDTLDIKDIQIILERNWNIRIPGYAADDIRTVRKFNPAPGYHQKMAALAAQKQLNQSAGKGGD